MSGMDRRTRNGFVAKYSPGSYKGNPDADTDPSRASKKKEVTAGVSESDVNRDPNGVQRTPKNDYDNPQMK